MGARLFDRKVASRQGVRNRVMLVVWSMRKKAAALDNTLRNVW